MGIKNYRGDYQEFRDFDEIFRIFEQVELSE
jgi:hypothetical protein